MKIGDCFYLGYVQKTIGNKGELALKLDVDSPSSYLGLDAVGLQMQKNDKTCIPYFILNSELLNSGNLRVSLEGVEDATEAKMLVGKQLYLSLEYLPSLEGNKFYFHEVIGFEVFDQQKGQVGIIKAVLEYSTSNLLSVEHPSGKEVLIPITDASILEVDRDKQKMRVLTADGLIDLYLDKE